MPGDYVSMTREQLDELDRNARAYGFEIGRGHELVEVIDIDQLSEDNPFLDKNWKQASKLAPPPEESDESIQHKNVFETPVEDDPGRPTRR